MKHTIKCNTGFLEQFKQKLPDKSVFVKNKLDLKAIGGNDKKASRIASQCRNGFTQELKDREDLILIDKV